jgi:hypothetical protein
MGTISDKLMRIINTKEDIRQALISKGYDVPTSIPFKEYAKMISDLPCKVDDFPKLPGDVTRWYFGGLTNEMMAAMDDPRIEDADHKGRFLSFKNFAWGGMSGVGGYTENYNSNKWYKVESRIDATWTYKSFNARSIKDNRSAQLFYQSLLSDTGFRVLSCTIKVSGLTDGQGIEYVSNGTQQFVIMRIENDGIYHLPSFDFGAKNAYYGFKFLKLQESCNITIEQLPLYPGALVFDGVDDCGTCDNFPILTKEKGYTVVALRKRLTPENKTDNEVLVANLKELRLETKAWGAFGCEIKYNNTNPKRMRTLSFGNMPIVNANENGVDIASGNDTGGPYLLICSRERSLFANAAIWELVFLDHDATEEELTKIKDYFVKTYPWLFPDQAWTVVGKTNEDEDRATIANITGNGNDLVLSNFGFAEGSGYGLYKQNFSKIQWTSPSARVEVTKTNSSFNITEVKKIAIQLYYLSNTNEVAFTVPSTKVRVTGLTDGQTINYRYFVDDVANDFLIPSDGIYNLPEFEFPAKNNYYGFNLTKVQSSCNITIEQIPEYEGYLVTDGVDDKIVSSSFGMGKDFTVVGEWTLLQNINVSSLRKQSSFIIRNNDLGLSLFINRISHAILVHTKSLRAFCSNGVLYKSDWTEQIDTTPQDITSSNSELLIASHFDNKLEYDKIAFKNLAIYPTVLSKDDCIKAYNYLQTLKAK